MNGRERRMATLNTATMLGIAPSSAGTIGSPTNSPNGENSPWQLRSYGDPILKTPAIDVDHPSDLAPGLVDRMKEVMQEYRGVGLAAQQVGSTQRVALIGGRSPIVAINLRIIEHSEETQLSVSEGCLSVMRDGNYFRTNVTRWAWVSIELMDLSGTWRRARLEGLEAIIAQHECDHLDGKCVVDGVSRQQRRQAERIMGR